MTFLTMPQIRHRVQAERDDRGHVSGDGGQDAGVAGSLWFDNCIFMCRGSFLRVDHAPWPDQ